MGNEKEANLKALQQADSEATELMWQADSYRRSLRDTLDTRQRKAAERFIEQAEAAKREVAKAMELELAEADRMAAKAKEKADAASVALGRAKLPYPEGTILHEWRETSGTWSRIQNWKRTGRTGKLEVAAPGMAIPDNRSSYSLPNMGAAIVRPIKASGETSIQFLEFGRNEFRVKWLPEGEKPKAGMQ